MNVAFMVFAVLNSYKVISTDRLNLFYMLAMAVTGMGSLGGESTERHIENIRRGIENDDNFKP